MTGCRTLTQRNGTHANGTSDLRAVQVSQRSDSGFTFIEVLVSLMILTILFTSVNHLFVQSARMHRTLLDSTAATQEQRAAMETALTCLLHAEWTEEGLLLPKGLFPEDLNNEDSLRENPADDEWLEADSSLNDVHELLNNVEMVRIWEEAPLVLVAAQQPANAAGTARKLFTIRYAGRPPWTVEQRRLVSVS
ncbi:MAG: prepilin-type N-terminal cleavage/methylation domain-containing protein [Bacillota bacterium]|nr:prepilin-type N-terminal cleavage/methylation domain-containing protein [Bacillota bacterium]MDW7677217.1 prepilin-type N-terminal cleavage/methylation domain-containing protein [Bacillota bacterium]